MYVKKDFDITSVLRYFSVLAYNVRCQAPNDSVGTAVCHQIMIMFAVFCRHAHFMHHGKFGDDVEHEVQG